MGRELIAESSPTGSNCGFSGVVPAGEEWCIVRVDNMWGAQGEFLIGSPGETVAVSRCHVMYQYIGIVNGQNFHYMRKYRTTPDVVTYDCINGACIESTTYKTPGIYTTLEECQANCGNGKDCKPCCVYKVECN